MCSCVLKPQAMKLCVCVCASLCVFACVSAREEGKVSAEDKPVSFTAGFSGCRAQTRAG